MTGDHQRHRGREATAAASMDAAEDLFSAHGFSAVTVRAIAERAGVSHALVHRYLGRKIDIWNAVLVRNATGILEAAPDDPDLLSTAELMLRSGLARHRPYVRLIAHSARHGAPAVWPPGMFGATERLVELARRAAAEAAPADAAGDDLDPRFVVACVVALFIGWVAAEPAVLARTGLEDMPDAEVVEGLVRVVRGMLADGLPVLPVGDSPSD